MSNDPSAPTDRVLLITGASSGIGAATARHAGAAGWRLVLAARSQERLQALAVELGGAERALAVPCDVTDWEAQQRLVELTLSAFGQIDAVFANAGFGGPRGFLKDTPEHWREMVLTNVYGVALTLRAAIPALTESRGHLLLTSSVAGRRVLPGSMYSCTKHAVTAMGEAARQDLDGTGIRVTLIEPGMVDTPFFENRPTNALQDDDIARAVLYALSQPPTSTSTRSSCAQQHRRARIVLYAYAKGQRSSRGIERACVEDVAYRVIAANLMTINRFRWNQSNPTSGVTAAAGCSRRIYTDLGDSREGW